MISYQFLKLIPPLINVYKYISKKNFCGNLKVSIDIASESKNREQ